MGKKKSSVSNSTIATNNRSKEPKTSENSEETGTRKGVQRLQNRSIKFYDNPESKKLFVLGVVVTLASSILIYSYQDNFKSIFLELSKNFDNYLSVFDNDEDTNLKPASTDEGHSKDDQDVQDERNHEQPDAGVEIKQDGEHKSTVSDANDIPSKNSAEKSLKPKYAKKNITNSLDNKIRSELDKADSAFEKGNVQESIDLYNAIVAKYPNSPRSHYGKGNVLNRLAELKRSNALLEEAIGEYSKVLSLPDVPKPLAVLAGMTCAERQSFRGWGGKAVKTMKQLIDLFPDDLRLRNELGVKYLMVGRIDDARRTFAQVLETDSANGFAKVHLGFIIKTTDHNYNDAIPYLKQGIASDEPGVIDGRFFFHLGDALYRTGQHNESYEVYRLGAEKGVFPSFWQRSLYNVDGLTARPWWTKSQSGNAKFLKKLEQNWETIRDEGLVNLDEKRGVFELESEDLREEGDWRQFTLYSQGRKHDENCKKVPKTCALLEGFTEAVNCKRGQIKYSVMQPGVHVWPHCGPTNCRIRSHLGLVIPDGPRIRIANETRTWKLGKFIVFDDSFEHEVWHEGASLRLVLIIDMWHPELTSYQKQTLAPI